MIDRALFYSNFRSAFGLQSLKQSQVDGVEAILNYWDGSTLHDYRWLAYILATVYHETGATFQPVREGFCKSDEDSVKAVTRLFERRKIKRNYALPHANGKCYFGRGFVQITHGHNYERVGKAIGLGMQLYENPSLALDLAISVKILFTGMVEGLFTSKRLQDYFNNHKTDWKNARKIINGMDKADLIAEYGKKFFNCLTKASVAPDGLAA